MKTPPIGARRRRFVLEVPLDSPDGFGGILRSYAAGPELWGAIQMVSAAERVRAGRAEQAVTHRVTLRHRDGVTAAMRLTSGPAPLRHPERGRPRRAPARPRLPGRGDHRMTSPILSLRAAILARCRSDADLATLMGGTVRLYDEPPRAAEPVYAVFDEAEARDASVDLCRGHEQDCAIVVWAKPGSARTALEAAERLAALLDDADLPLVGHRLVNLRVVSIACGRDDKTGLARATLRLRAVTEVA